MRKKNRTFFVEFDEVERIVKDRGDTVRIKLLIEVKNYAKGCTYSSRKNAKEVITYWSRPSEDVATILGMSDGNVRQIKTMLSDSLYTIFGGDFLEKICKGSIEDLRECKLLLQVLKQKSSIERYFSKEEVDIVASLASHEDFDISECKEEYLFLKRHCLQNFKLELLKVDPSKVAFLMRVIEGKAGTPRDIYGFIKKFNEMEEMANAGESE